MIGTAVAVLAPAVGVILVVAGLMKLTAPGSLARPLSQVLPAWTWRLPLLAPPAWRGESLASSSPLP